MCKSMPVVPAVRDRGRWEHREFKVILHSKFKASLGHDTLPQKNGGGGKLLTFKS